jgi:multidrug resistance efflux pump
MMSDQESLGGDAVLNLVTRRTFFAMIRVLALLALLIPAGVLSLAEDQSPRNKSEESDSVDVEPPVLRQNLSDDRSAGATAGEVVARLEKKLAEAKGDAEGVERLCKNGALSKVEMEQRLLKAIQCEAELANARLAEAKGKAIELESKVASGETAKDQLASARAALTQLNKAAEAATAKRERAELQAAETNVNRQQELLKLGLAAKADVDRAEEKLTDLKAQRN